MNPSQLLTGNLPLATTLQLATVGRELPATASPLTVSKMPGPPTRTKQWCHSSNQEAVTRPEEEEVTGLHVTPKEHPS